MKIMRKILCCLILCVFAINLTACEEDNSLEAAVYCKNTINYELANEQKTEGTFKLSEIIDSCSPMNQYSRIQIMTDKNWTYGLEIERIEFDIVLSAPSDVDIELTISNLENGANFNESENTYYYHKTLSINKENTSVKLDINDVFNKKDSVFSFEINKSCYTSNKDLKLGIANFKMFGKHTEANY